MKIKSIMVPAKLNAAPNANVKQLIDDMVMHNHTCGLIGEGNKLIGVLDEHEIMMTCKESLNNTDFQSLEALKVSDIMDPEPFCLHQDTPVYDALVTAKVKQLRSLPVVDDEHQLVGIVTQRELLDTYIKLMDQDKDLRVTNKKLESLALEDALMGIGSRHAMKIDLIYTEAQAKRNNTYYAVAMLDVDFFKSYNDKYGHQSGDQALLSIANIIKQVKRKSDRVYRYGGEEVLIIMSGTELEGAKESAERIRAAIEEAQIEHLGSKLNVLTVSIGVSSEQAGNWKQMVKLADIALYHAKQTGRNCVL